jgi:hypothetical protein
MEHGLINSIHVFYAFDHVTLSITILPCLYFGTQVVQVILDLTSPCPKDAYCCPLVLEC